MSIVPGRRAMLAACASLLVAAVPVIAQSETSDETPTITFGAVGRKYPPVTVTTVPPKIVPVPVPREVSVGGGEW